jgi:hypothetical protein
MVSKVEEVAHNNHPSPALLMKSFGIPAHDTTLYITPTHLLSSFSFNIC